MIPKSNQNRILNKRNRKVSTPEHKRRPWRTGYPEIRVVEMAHEFGQAVREFVVRDKRGIPVPNVDNDQPWMFAIAG
jgi:hypothetical protein